MRNILLGTIISFSALSQPVAEGRPNLLKAIDCAIEKQRFTDEYSQAIRIKDYYERKAKKREQYLVELAEQLKEMVDENKAFRDELLAYSSEYQALSLELKKAGKGKLNARDDAKLRQMSDLESSDDSIEEIVARFNRMALNSETEKSLEDPAITPYSGLSFNGIKRGAFVIELSPIEIRGVAISETTKLLVRADTQGKLLVEVDDSAFLRELFKKEDLRLISVDEYVKRKLSEACKESEEQKRENYQSRETDKARSGLNLKDIRTQYESVIKR